MCGVVLSAIAKNEVVMVTLVHARLLPACHLECNKTQWNLWVVQRLTFWFCSKKQNKQLFTFQSETQPTRGAGVVVWEVWSQRVLNMTQSLCSGAAKVHGSGAGTGTAKMLCTVEAGTELRVHMDHSRSAGQAKRFLFWSKLHSIGNVANKNVS